MDADAWRIVQSGFNLFSTGIYQPSRFPGYPLPEFIAGAIWLTNLPFTTPWIFNLVSALFSVTAAYYFLCISIRFIHKKRFVIYLSAVTFAFIPVIYVNSTGMMDYNWALAFMLGAIYYLISKRLKLSALFLAFATGCRITSALFIIPVLFYVITSIDIESRKRKILEYVIIFTSTAVIIFSPVIFKYGTAFLSFDRPPYQYSIIKIIGRMTLRTWGAIGSLGVLFAGLMYFVSGKKKIHQKLIDKNKLVVFVLISIVIYLILFLSLPLDAGYLIPMVPFFVLLLYRILSQKVLISLSLLLLISPFVLNIDENNITLAGPILIDSHKRIEEENYVMKVINLAKSSNKPSLIICESFLPKIQVMMILQREAVPKNVNFIYMIPFDSLKSIVKNENPEIFYLKNVRGETLAIYNYDLDSFGVKEIN